MVEGMKHAEKKCREIDSGISYVEADFNTNNGFIGRRMMANAERHGIIAQEPYGSRTGHSSQVESLNKQLVF